MSLRCKACNKLLDTKDPDYCEHCLQVIKYFDYEKDVVEQIIGRDEDIINEIIQTATR